MKVFVYHKPSPHSMGPAVREEIIAKMGTQPLLEGPVNLRMRFIFTRPYGNVEPCPQTEHPPTWALVRAILNQLPGILYHEERQVVSVHSLREYGNVNGIEVKC